MQNFTQNFKDRINYDQFNNYRVDLNIILVQNGETVLVNNKDKSILVNLYDLSTLAEALGEDHVKCAKYLMDCMADANEKYLTEDFAMVIAFRKEAKSLKGDDVRQRLWKEFYGIHEDLESIMRNNPILNVFNEPLPANPYIPAIPQPGTAD